MDQQAVIRRIRIAASVFFAVLTMALCVLWVRSFTAMDYFRYHLSQERALSISSREGMVGVSTWTKGVSGVSWEMKSSPVSGLPPKRHVENPLGFELILSEEYGGISGILPFWFLVVVSASLVALPWLRLPQRFSLRTMLIATTLFAVVLGLVCYAVR